MWGSWRWLTAALALVFSPRCEAATVEFQYDYGSKASGLHRIGGHRRFITTGRRHGRQVRNLQRRAHVRHGQRVHHTEGGIPSRVKQMSTEDALQQVPARLSNLFTDFQRQRTGVGANGVLDQLNKVYQRSLAEKDILSLDCEDKLDASADDVKTARRALEEIEIQLTQVQDRLQTLQRAKDHLDADSESLRVENAHHTNMCNRDSQALNTRIAMLEKDLPMAKDMVKQATRWCNDPSARAPTLVECMMPDGSYFMTFEDQGHRQRIAQLSNFTENMASLYLESAVQGNVARHAGTLFLEIQGLRQNLHGPWGQHRTRGLQHSRNSAFLQRLLQEEDAPSPQCSRSRDCYCGSLKDNLNTMIGQMEDMIAGLKERTQNETKHCNARVASYDAQVKDFRRQLGDNSVNIANTVAKRGEVSAMRRDRRTQLVDVGRQNTQQNEDCKKRLDELDSTLRSTKKLKLDMGRTTGSFIGDCITTDWVRGPCSVECGPNGGTQTVTRVVAASPPTGTPMCPNLTMTRACNVRPCPVDGKTGRWEDWSECSKSCGGGTRTRQRKVVQEARHGGLPLPETLQQELCNTRTCDEDCALAPWTAWTNCSLPCSSGHFMRTRREIQTSRGSGSCPAETSSARREVQSCNDKACVFSSPPQCATALDVLLLLDSSGSLGGNGFENVRTFANTLSQRFDYGTRDKPIAKFGVVSFSDTANTDQALTGYSNDVMRSLSNLRWQGKDTNTGEALALAGTEIETNGRQGVQQLVVVVTDGMPVSTRVVASEVTRLRGRNVRIVFVMVGQAVSSHALASWVTWPMQENVVRASAIDKLGDDQVNELVLKVCPVPLNLVP